MSDRWEVKEVTDNRGKPLSVWCWADYELCENVNMGSEGGWMFELTLGGQRVAVRPTLKEGKQAAREHSESMQVMAADVVVPAAEELALAVAS